MKLRLRVEQVIGDGLPSELLLSLQVIIDVEMLERVIAKETALIFDAIEYLADCGLALELLSHRVYRYLLPFVMLFTDRSLRTSSCPFD